MTKEEVALPAALVGLLLVLVRLTIAFWPRRKRPAATEEDKDWRESGADGL